MRVNRRKGLVNKSAGSFGSRAKFSGISSLPFAGPNSAPHAVIDYVATDAKRISGIRANFRSLERVLRAQNFKDKER
jgi:hypothetical protein